MTAVIRSGKGFQQIEKAKGTLWGTVCVGGGTQGHLVLGVRKKCVTDSVMEWKRVRKFLFAKSEASVEACLFIYLYVNTDVFVRSLVRRPATLEVVIELVSHALLNTPHALFKNNSSENQTSDNIVSFSSFICF